MQVRRLLSATSKTEVMRISENRCIREYDAHISVANVTKNFFVVLFFKSKLNNFYTYLIA